MISLVLALALAQPPAPEPLDAFRPDPGWRPLGPSLWFDPKAKRLVLRGRVCLREGALEHLICKSRTKEHESVLATDATPKLIHAGLLLTGAQVGGTARFVPDYRPAHGTPIAIELEWTEAGATKKADARQWIVDFKKAPLKADWVFAGSNTYTDPETKQVFYGADDGDLATVANFESSLLDLPIPSTASDSERSFQANTEKVPPLGTPVTIVLRPRAPLSEKSKAPPAGKSAENGKKP